MRSLLVPLYVVRLGATLFDLGLLGAAAAPIGASGAILWGRLADRTSNPRNVVVASLVGVAGLLSLTPLVDVVLFVIGVYAALSTLTGGIGSVGGGALASGYGFTTAFIGGGVVILAGTGLVLALRSISSRTRSLSPRSGRTPSNEAMIYSWVTST